MKFVLISLKFFQSCVILRHYIVRRIIFQGCKIFSFFFLSKWTYHKEHLVWKFAGLSWNLCWHCKTVRLSVAIKKLPQLFKLNALPPQTVLTYWLWVFNVTSFFLTLSYYYLHHLIFLWRIFKPSPYWLSGQWCKNQNLFSFVSEDKNNCYFSTYCYKLTFTAYWPMLQALM